jgi:ABC-2 type transport system permease protein
VSRAGESLCIEPEGKLTYEVDGLRALMLAGGGSSLGLGLDFTVLTVTLAVLVAWAGKMYPRIVV